MRIVEAFDEDVNFWTVVPLLKTIEPTKELYKEDKKRDHTDSSKVMWAIAICYDMNSKLWNLPIEEKHKIAGINILKDPDYIDKNIKKLQPIIDFYIKLQDTPALRVLREWEEKMIKRAKFLKETEYTLDSMELDEETNKYRKVTGTADTLDRMLSNTKKLYDDYDRILAQISKEETKGTVMGGGEKSLSDAGEDF